MRKTLLIVIAALALAVLVVPAAFAATNGSSGQDAAQAGQQAAPGCGLGPRFCQDLGLSDDQLDQIQAIRDKVQAETQDLWAQMDQIRDQLRELRRSGADQAQIDAKVQELDQVRQAIQDKVAGHLDEVKGVLTPEQSQKLIDRAYAGLLGGPGMGNGFGGGRGHGFGHGFGRGFGRGFGQGDGWRCPMPGTSGDSSQGTSGDSGQGN